MLSYVFLIVRTTLIEVTWLFYQVEYLDPAEKQFWATLVHKYLKPIKKDKQTEQKIQSDLIEMRNSSSFGFWVVNVLWILLNFMLQIHVMPITVFVKSDGTKIKCAPLGFVFIIFFLIILGLQVVGMLKHRLLSCIF
jgi:chitin synthase